MIINKSGIIIRVAVNSLRVMGRATQGVRIIKLNEGDEIAAITKVDVEEEEIENTELTDTSDVPHIEINDEIDKSDQMIKPEGDEEITINLT